MRTWCLLAVLVLAAGPAAAPAAAHELLVNGDFEADASVGWVRSETGSGGLVERRTDLDQDPDYELRISLPSGDGILQLAQRVAVPNLDVTLAATLRCAAYGDGGAWSVAGLALRYLDRHLARLGETVVVAPSRDCPWVSTPTFHLVEATAGEWEPHLLTLAGELAQLPGVDPERIAVLEVALLYDAENC